MNQFEQLNTILEDIMVRWDIPGLGVGLVEEGHIVHAQGYGVQNLATLVTTSSLRSVMNSRLT